MILAIFDLLPTKFHVSWPPVQEKKRKIVFEDALHSGHLGFPIGKILAILIYKSPRCFLPSFKSVCLSVQKKRKIDIQDGGHLGFPIRTIIAIFDLQVTSMLPTKFRANRPRGVGGIGF